MGGGVHLEQPASVFLAKITLTLSLQFFENNLKLEADSQVLQGVQAGEGLLGDGSDLVPLQISRGGGWKASRSTRLVEFIVPHFQGGNTSDGELTASSACPAPRKARSCLQWSRRFHSSGDPFCPPRKQRQTAL